MRRPQLLGERPFAGRCLYDGDEGLGDVVNPTTSGSGPVTADNVTSNTAPHGVRGILAARQIAPPREDVDLLVLVQRLEPERNVERKSFSMGDIELSSHRKFSTSPANSLSQEPKP